MSCDVDEPGEAIPEEGDESNFLLWASKNVIEEVGICER